MRLLIVLFAFVCAFEAAKFKYFVENVGDKSFVDGIWVLHDRNFDLFVNGERPSKGLLNYIQSGKSAEYMAEIRSKKGVSDVELLPNLSANTAFYVQADRETDRVSFIVRTSASESFLGALGSRFPTDVVTSFNADFKLWNISPAVVSQSSESNSWVHWSGRQICPNNDATVFVKIENVGDYALGNPLFWTQAGGSNDVFWPGGAASTGFTELLTTGNTDTLLSETRWNEDVCYSWVATGADLSAQGNNGIWEIPVAQGQKLFFSVHGSKNNEDETVDNWVFGAGNNGIVLYKDGSLQSAFSVNSDLTVYTSTNGKVQIVRSATASESLHTYVYDHFPTGAEFPEEEDDITDGYDIGLCGSYVKNADGIYEPKEWGLHPYDCTDQEGGDKCMFCKGRANDKVRSVCLPRLGSGCNAAFNSPPRPTFCNLEFECPASTISFPLFVILSLLGVLFFAL